MKKENTYLLRLEWKCSTLVTVPASSLDDAILNAQAEFKPNDPSFVDGSLVVDREEARILNEEF